MSAATHLVVEAQVRLNVEPEQVTYEQVAALAFGLYRYRVEEREAADHLAAALIAHGHGIGHLPAVPD
ncbi:hypothetical protein ACIBCB_37300 [Streptomyces uncialis]|uniref:hypothetical protein n=1 Tax=Streptomyces uncialis TaxID=1048205 RepID=UPI0037A89B7C